MTIFGLTLEQWVNFKLYMGLAGPLLLVVYLPIVLTGLLFLGARKWRWWIKSPILLVYLVMAYAVPLGDVTVNSINMAKVCGKVGLHIKRTVEVDGFYGGVAPLERLKKNKYKFIEDLYLGRVTRFERHGSVINEIPMAEPSAEWEYVTLSFDRRDVANGVSISRHEVIRNRRSGEVIAEEISYAAWSGWIDKKIAAVIDNPLGTCYSRPFMYESIDKILIPKELDK